jgi:hypothetical protein
MIYVDTSGHQKIIRKSTDRGQDVRRTGCHSAAVSQHARRWREHMNRIIFVFVAFGVVACNVEGSDDSANQNGVSRSVESCTPRSYEELSQYGFGCRETIPGGSGTTSGSGSTGGGESGGAATASSHPANIANYAEYEPNNVPENANPVAFPAVSGDTVPGIEITGAVRDVSDESDYFILSPNQTGVYAIYLCADTCTEHPTDSMVAIRVIDQFGTVIAGNPLYEESTKIVTAGLDAGIPYYVQVFGFDTQGQEYPYKLVIID